MTGVLCRPVHRSRPPQAPPRIGSSPRSFRPRLHVDAVHQRVLATLVDTPQKRAGTAWGEQVADAILHSRVNDGSDTAAGALPVGAGPGSWEPTPPGFGSYLLPLWGLVTPFALPNVVDVRPPGPPALTSERWAADYNEVKALGAAVGSTRTDEQTRIAVFWADGVGTETPPGHWNRIARDLGSLLGNTLEQNARLFALLNLAMADAAICAWDAKYAFHFWRPVTAIRRGDSDGNPNTVADATWSPFIATPPFPDYVSGHSAFSGAAATWYSPCSTGATTSPSTPAPTRFPACTGSSAVSPRLLRKRP